MSRTPPDQPESVQRQIERLFRDIVYRRHPSAHFADQPWAPPADLVVSERSARVILELAGVPLGSFKTALKANPFDVKTAFIAAGATSTLLPATVLGRPSKAPGDTPVAV